MPPMRHTEVWPVIVSFPSPTSIFGWASTVETCSRPTTHNVLAFIHMVPITHLTSILTLPKLICSRTGQRSFEASGCPQPHLRALASSGERHLAGEGIDCIQRICLHVLACEKEVASELAGLSWDRCWLYDIVHTAGTQYPQCYMALYLQHLDCWSSSRGDLVLIIQSQLFWKLWINPCNAKLLQVDLADKDLSCSSEGQQVKLLITDMDMDAVEVITPHQQFCEVGSIHVYKKVHMATWKVGSVSWRHGMCNLRRICYKALQQHTKFQHRETVLL